MVTATPSPPLVDAVPLRAGSTLEPDAFHEIRRSLVLQSCKWDPQVGDIETISRFPLFLCRKHWRWLAETARLLTAELMAAERELIARPELHRGLGLPRSIRSVLRSISQTDSVPCPARILRFDFHWTDEGWRISEVNSDVPGGFTEASTLSRLFAKYFPSARPAGDPGQLWADAMARSIGPEQLVALLAASGFVEDQQVVNYLERLLIDRGVRTRRTTPDYIQWRDGIACLGEPLGAIVRFYQAEWLNARRDRCMFTGGRTPIVNPGSAILTESKRFPLTWDELTTPLPTWRRLLPETRDPRDVSWQNDEQWLVKSAFCNTGDSVGIRSLLTDRQWGSLLRRVWLKPRGWIAQRRFAIAPISTHVGVVFPCIGVYTINGEPAGIYGRYSRTQLVDFAAVDVAVLIEDESGETS
jgi:glutathionylspermidine synthase